MIDEYALNAHLKTKLEELAFICQNPVFWTEKEETAILKELAEIEAQLERSETHGRAIKPTPNP